MPKPGQNDPNWFVSYGWTILPLFDTDRKLLAGIWKLPLYQAPVLTSLDVRDIETLKPIHKSLLCLRLSHISDDLD